MKIEKAIFSSSEPFSPAWNNLSKIYKTKLGIEPICLLFGKKANTDMSEEFGKVIEVPVMENWPLLIQITWSKFFWPTLEPDTTWLVGDIDLYPLQTAWFTTNLTEVPDDHYVHLNADGITSLNGTPYTWHNKPRTKQNLVDCGHGTCLPGHYHVAKGWMFKKALEQNGSWEEEIAHIVTSGHYNGTRAFRESDPIDQCQLWCAEEMRSTKAIRKQLLAGNITLTTFFMRSPHVYRFNDAHRIDDGFTADLERLKNGEYVDIHLKRPFKEFKQHTEDLLRIANMI